MSGINHAIDQVLVNEENGNKTVICSCGARWINHKNLSDEEALARYEMHVKNYNQQTQTL